MNFVKKVFVFKNIKKGIYSFSLLLLSCIFVFIVGCGDQVNLPSMSHLNEFVNAGPSQLTVDESRLIRAKIGAGPYRVAPHEVLELTMPTILRIVTVEESVGADTFAPFICRVSANGIITLPVIGEIEVAGKTLAEIESLVIDKYYPEYAVTRPSVFIKVLEYDTIHITICGAVVKPGVYSLRRDQMSLVALLMEAGGIVESGAALIRIVHRENVAFSDNQRATDGISGEFMQHGTGTYSQAGLVEMDEKTQNKLIQSSYSDTEYKGRFMINRATEYKAPDGGISGRQNIQNKIYEDIPRQAEPANPQNSKSLVLPIKGLNIPFADVALYDGDMVIVERLQMPLFTVIGLVNRPGNFEYPPDSQFNLMQALAFAGGLNPIADPRYVTIYRLKPDGTIVSVYFKLVSTDHGPSLTDALNVKIKPGDIVSVEHTPRTRTNMFLERIFRINIGTYFNLNDAFDDN